jgi:diaminopimelate epimerase
MTDWADIPLAEAADTLHLPIDGDPVATSMGNPHCTFFVDDAEAVDLAAAPEIESITRFSPQRTNVQFASLIAPDHLRMRVWERGTGVTLASGSSSCAVAVAAARGDLTGRSVRLTLDGGEIAVDWRDTGVWMTGPTAHVFSGVLTADFLEGAVAWTAAPPSSTRSAAASTPMRPRRCGNFPPPPGSRMRWSSTPAP